MITKKCRICKEIKSVDKFNKQEDCKYGITSWCKICQGEYAKTYYENNSEKIKEYGRKYGKEYYKNKPKRFYAYTKEYRKNNPEKIKDWFKKSRKKRELNPMFKLNDRISNLIKQSLRNNKNGKSGKHWEDLVGYNLQDLMSHLEKLFKPGMTFDNHGKWHIDHRRPVSSFNFNSYKDKEFLECWTLSNLQPLWARENISKGAKYEN